jgi:hypothetical protein
MKPGVGVYDIATKPRILGTYTYKSFGGTFTDDATFKGMSTPGSYPAIQMNVYKDRAMVTKMCKPIRENPALERCSKI